MNKLKLIIKREFLAKVRNKTFLVMTILSPVLVVGLGILVGYISKENRDSVKTIALIDEANLFAKLELESNNSFHFESLDIDVEIAKSQTKQGDYYGLLYIPKKDSIADVAKSIEFYSKTSPSIIFITDLENLVGAQLNQHQMRAFGINLAEWDNSKLKSEIKILSFTGEKSSKLIRGIKITIGIAAGYMIMMFIIVYGAMVMRSVIEEKTSRIIEVIISSVKPFQLMMGKIIGTAFAGLLQFTIWGLLLLVIGFVLTSFFGINTQEFQSVDTINNLEFAHELPESNMQLIYNELLNLPLFTLFFAYLIYFLGGYLLYSALYAAIGAAVDNETDTQQFMLPVIFPLILAVYIGFASVINEPHGFIATLFSMIPFTSPIVMMMRIPFGVPWWQIVVSLILLIGTFIALVWFAAKIYRIGILMYGKKPSYKDIYKWLRY